MQNPKKTSDSDRRLARAVEVELARRDINYFCEFCFREPDGSAWRQQAFHREWQSLLPMEGSARVLICAPRESAKTSQMAIARTLFELGKNPDLRIKIVCAGEDLAQNIVSAIGEHIIRNPRLRQVFPHLKPASAGLWPRPGAQSGRLVVARKSQEKDPSISAHSILSTAVGGRADLIIFDDVVDFRNTIANPALQPQVMRSFFEAYINLLGPKGRAVYVSTVWSQNDLTMELRRNPEWQVWWRPARDSATGILLWPERWDDEALSKREREIGLGAFSQQFLLQAMSDEQRSFPSFPKCIEYGVSPRQLAEKGWRYFCGVDLSTKARAGTVVVTIGVGPDELRVPVDVQILKDPVALPGVLVALYEKYRHQSIVVENNATQDVIVDMIRAATRCQCMLPLKPFMTSSQKCDQASGLPALEVEFANGMWRFAIEHEPGLDDKGAWARLVREFISHPFGSSDDVVMATWFARSAINKKRPLLLGNLDDLWAPSPWHLLGETPAFRISGPMDYIQPAPQAVTDRTKPSRRRLSFGQ